MSKEKLSKLLSMICNPVKRQHLIEFKVLAFCVSEQVEKAINGDDEAFYFALSKIQVDSNGYAEAHFENHQLYITVIEVADEGQAESIFIFHIVTISEELERELEQLEIEEWAESGAIEIE